MKNNTDWDQDWMQDADELGVIVQGRQTELVPDARLDQLDNSSQSMHTRLARWLLHTASVVAMALQTAQLTV
jgi:hypothetical protein